MTILDGCISLKSVQIFLVVLGVENMCHLLLNDKMDQNTNFAKLPSASVNFVIKNWSFGKLLSFFCASVSLVKENLRGLRENLNYIFRALDNTTRRPLELLWRICLTVSFRRNCKWVQFGCPPIYLRLIFAIIQFEISSLMNWILFLVWTGFFCLL